MSKRNFSTSSSHSKRRDDDSPSRGGTQKKTSGHQRPSSAASSRGKLSKSSFERKSDDDEDRAAFYKNCRSIYLMVFEETQEDITSAEELTLLLQYAGCNPTRKLIAKLWGDSRDCLTYYQFCNILKQESPTPKKELLKAFKKIDINGDGFITHDELISVLTTNGERMTKAEVKDFINDADYNGDGKLDYYEFCDMMMATTEKCGKVLKNSKRKERTGRGKEKQGRRETTSAKSESPKPRPNRKSESSNESTTKSSLRRKSGSRQNSLKENDGMSDSEPKPGETYTPKVIREPTDLSKWRYCSSKGSFYLEDDGSIESHQYRLLVLEATEIFISIQATTPKYGKFRKDLLESDITLFLRSEGKDRKLISFTESRIDKKFCLKANVEPGSYELLTFTSGVLLSQKAEEPRSPSKLVIGEGENAKFTKACRETLFEIFYRCDLDGNGFLNRSEFNQFQLKTSGEGCDDDAWDVVKENFEMNNKEEITPDGFLSLNMMEASDPDGGTDELWVSIESMGYNKGLELVKAFPFQIEAFTRKGDCALEVVGVSNGGKGLEDCLMESIKNCSSKTPFRGNKNVILYIGETEVRKTLAVENKTYVPVRIRLMCNKSVNAQSKQESLDFVCNLDPKETQIVEHLIAKKAKQPIRIDCEESILK